MSTNTSEFTKEVQAILNDFRLEEVVSHLLRRAHFIAEDIFSHEFSTESITPRQKAVLVIVTQNPGLKQSELAEHLYVDRNTITDIVKRLCTNELLVRKSCKEDQRAYELNISSKGIELLNKILPRDLLVEKKILKRVPKEYQPIFLKCLKLMIDPTLEV